MLQFRLLILSSLYMYALCCYGDDTNYEIKLLLKDVVAQLKKQNKRTERALDFLDLQNERLSDVLIQLDFQRRKAENVLELLHKQDIKVVTMIEALENFKPPVIIRPPPAPPTKSIPIHRPEMGHDLDFLGPVDNNYGRGNQGPTGFFFPPKPTESYGPRYTDPPSVRYPDPHPPRIYTDPPYEQYPDSNIWRITDPPKRKTTTEYVPPKTTTEMTTLTTEKPTTTISYRRPPTTTTTSLPIIRAGELKVRTPHEFIGAPLQANVEMHCFVENSGSRAILFWRFNGTALPTISLKYRRTVEHQYPGPKKMKLRMMDLHIDDRGYYDCVVNDSGDSAYATIRVYILDTII